MITICSKPNDFKLGNLKVRKIIFFLAVICGFTFTNIVLAQPVMKLIITEPNFVDFTNPKSVFKESEDISSFTIRNTGASSFTGIVSYKDSWGSALELEEVSVVYQGNAGTPPTINWVTISGNVLNSTTTNGSLVSGTTYQLSITNLLPSAGTNHSIVITRKVKVIDCIDINTKGISTVELQTCDNTGNSCALMQDSWQSDQSGAQLPRLTQRISKGVNELMNMAQFTSKF